MDDRGIKKLLWDQGNFAAPLASNLLEQCHPLDFTKCYSFCQGSLAGMWF